MTSGQQIAILLGMRPPADLRTEVASGRYPRMEYSELAEQLGAELIDLSMMDRSSDISVQWMRRRLGDNWAIAHMAVLQRNQFRDIYVTSESLGLPLAIQLIGCRARPRLTVVVHAVTSQKRRLVFRLVHEPLTRLICLSSEVQRMLIDELHVPREKVYLLHNWLDQHFFRSSRNEIGDYVLSVGMEARDYVTLRHAAAGIPIRFHVVGSGFSPNPGFQMAQGAEAASNVVVGTGYTYTELRELYDGARLVVLPLYAVSYAAGVTSILEGMAMGKAIIASDSPGIRDYVKHGRSGLLVPPGDPIALRAAIVDLWHDPYRLAEMGRHNRAWVESELNTDDYVNKVCGLLRDGQLNAG